MKKILASILAVLYFTASSGVVLNMHYCMGKLASVNVDHLSVKSCMCGTNESKNGCCGDEIKVLKVNNVHQASVADLLVKIPVSTLPTIISLIDISKLPNQQVSRPLAHAPPEPSGPASHILHCVFLI